MFSLLDLKFIRNNPDLVKNNLIMRGSSDKLTLVDEVIDLNKKWRENITETNRLRAKRNLVIEEIAVLKKQKKNIEDKIGESILINEKIKSLDKETEKHKEKINYCLMLLPNLMHESVPFGRSEEDNVEIRNWMKKHNLISNLKAI